MMIRDAFEQKILPFKEKLSPEDYNKLLEAGEQFGKQIFQSNMLAHVVNSGFNIHFWWQEAGADEKPGGNQYKIFMEADNFLTEEHLDGDPKGYGSAEEALKGLVDAIRDNLQKKDDAKQRIIRPNEVN